MSNKDRLTYIAHIALAIRQMSRHADRNAEKIDYFSEVIFHLTCRTDAFVEDNKEQFDSALLHAKAITGAR